MSRRTGCLFFIIVLLIGAGLGYAVVRIIVGPGEEVAITPVVEQSSNTPNFEILALQTDENQRRILRCLDNSCHQIPQVASASKQNAVTDGASWYHYQEEEDTRRGFDKKILSRTWTDSNKTQKLVEQTPLTEPRGLYISPDNQKLAYWLDNIDQPAKELTELWVYDASEGGTKLVGEKIDQSGVVTDVRWNRAASLLWFVGTTSEPDEVSLHLVNLSSPSLTLAFPEHDWSDLAKTAATGPMDITQSGHALAYTKPSLLPNHTKLIIQQAGQPSESTTVRGNIPYLQWQGDTTLIYATQSSQSFTIWQVANNIHKHVARINGSLVSARGDTDGSYVLIAATRGTNNTEALVIDLTTNTSTSHGFIPAFGNSTHIIQVTPVPDEQLAGTTTDLADEELAAFIDQHMDSIAGETAQAARLIITDQPNTVIIDYRTDIGLRYRVVTTIKDAIHPEWSISARYREEAGEWQKIAGGGLADSKPTRLYEWENYAKQWILKETYD